MEEVKRVVLGKKYEDTVSSFTGIAVCRSDWLHGCVRISLQPPVDKDGKMPTTEAFDEAQLVLVENTNLRHAPDEPIGGPSLAPATRANEPSR